MTDPNEPNEKPTPSKRRRSSRQPMSMKQIQRELKLKEAARLKQDQEIEQLKIDLAQNAREQKAQRGLQVINKTLERLHPADVSTFLSLLSPFVVQEQDLENMYSWQEMQAELASASDQQARDDSGPAASTHGNDAQ